MNGVGPQTEEPIQSVVATNDQMPDSQQPQTAIQSQSVVAANGHITDSLAPANNQDSDPIASTNDKIPDADQQKKVQQQVEEQSQPVTSTNEQIPESLHSQSEQEGKPASTMYEPMLDSHKPQVGQPDQSVTTTGDQVSDYQQPSTVTPMAVDPSQPSASAASPITKEQWKWCNNTLKALRKHKSSGPFLEPVDIVKFNIPDYPNIVKHPMDLGTVQVKVNTQQYSTIDDFVADVRLIFSNCYLFNGHDSPISIMATELEKAFDRAVYKMPTAEVSRFRLRYLSWHTCFLIAIFLPFFVNVQAGNVCSGSNPSSVSSSS
jgi:hypothetical protein